MRLRRIFESMTTAASSIGQSSPDVASTSSQQNSAHDLKDAEELDKTANDEATSDLLQHQQDTEQQVKDQQRQLVQPQMQQLDQSFNDLSQNLTQGKGQVQNTNETYDNLGHQMSQVQSMIKSLEKSLL